MSYHDILYQDEMSGNTPAEQPNQSNGEQGEQSPDSNSAANMDKVGGSMTSNSSYSGY